MAEQIAEKFMINRYIYFLKHEGYINQRDEIRLGTDKKPCLDDTFLIREHVHSGLPISPAADAATEHVPKIVLTRAMIRPLLTKFDGKRLLTNFKINAGNEDIRARFVYISAVKSSENLKALIPALVDTNINLQREMDDLQREKDMALTEVQDRDHQVGELRTQQAETSNKVKMIAQENDLLAQTLSETRTRLQELLYEKEKDEERSRELDDTLTTTKEQLNKTRIEKNIF